MNLVCLLRGHDPRTDEAPAIRPRFHHGQVQVTYGRSCQRCGKPYFPASITREFLVKEVQP